MLSWSGVVKGASQILLALVGAVSLYFFLQPFDSSLPILKVTPADKYSSPHQASVVPLPTIAQPSPTRPIPMLSPTWVRPTHTLTPPVWSTPVPWGVAPQPPAVSTPHSYTYTPPDTGHAFDVPCYRHGKWDVIGDPKVWKR